MQDMGNRVKRATAIGLLVLGTALVSITVAAQQQEKHGAQMQQQSLQQSSKAYSQYIEDRVQERLARSISLAGTDINVDVENRTVHRHRSFTPGVQLLSFQCCGHRHDWR